jgi:hypothetical protein
MELGRQHQANQLAQEKTEWAQDVQDYLNSVICHCNSDYDIATKEQVLFRVKKLEQSRLWKRDYEALKDERLYGWHGVLAVLLTIQKDVTTGYARNMSVFRVIEAGLRKGHSQGSKQPFAIMFLWAYKNYRPNVLPKNHKWLVDQGKKIKASLDAGESIYIRYRGYDEAISLLFPELAMSLESSFGREPTFC